MACINPKNVMYIKYRYFYFKASEILANDSKTQHSISD